MTSRGGNNSLFQNMNRLNKKYKKLVVAVILFTVLALWGTAGGRYELIHGEKSSHHVAHSFVSDQKQVDLRKIGSYNTYMVYSSARELRGKIEQYNDMLISQSDILSKETPCKLCLNPCSWSKDNNDSIFKSVAKNVFSWVLNQAAAHHFTIARGFTVVLDSSGPQNKDANAFREVTEAPPTGNSSVYAPKPRKIRKMVTLYDYMTNGAKGINTYILSWRSNEESHLNSLNASYLNSVLHTKAYYKCFSSPRIKAMGGWGNVSGSVSLLTCRFKCSDDITDLNKPVKLSPETLLTDYTQTMYRSSCSDSINYQSNATSMSKFTSKDLNLDIITALDIVHVGGIVLPAGLVFTNDHAVLFSFDCRYKASKLNLKKEQCTSYGEITYIDEVFIISQQPNGFNFYHFFTEQLPRISAFVPLLQSRPMMSIHVHVKAVPRMSFWMQIFGLTNPVVSGLVQAKTIYLPHGGSCHNAHIPAAQITSSIYREYISQKLLPTVNSKFTEKQTVILIKRQQRPIANHEEVYSLLKNFTKSTDYELIVFDDTNLPSIEETMTLFYNAKLIVAQHGAGLSNILFSQPGTTIVEVHCIGVDNVRLSFTNLAIKLGMRYYGTLTAKSHALSARCMEEGVTFDIIELKKVLSFVFTYL